MLFPLSSPMLSPQRYRAHTHTQTNTHQKTIGSATHTHAMVVHRWCSLSLARFLTTHTHTLLAQLAHSQTAAAAAAAHNSKSTLACSRKCTCLRSCSHSFISRWRRRRRPRAAYNAMTTSARAWSCSLGWCDEPAPGCQLRQRNAVQHTQLHPKSPFYRRRLCVMVPKHNSL